MPMTVYQPQADLPDILASDAERAAGAAQLKRACVEGRLTLEEFGQRVSQAQRARTRGELHAVTRDLPPGAAPLAASGAGTALARQRPVSNSVAILGSVERTGNWRIDEESRAIAVCGECKLDLRHAVISAPVTTIAVRVVAGNLKIIVPEGVHVDLDANGIMASKKVRLSGQLPAAEAPVIRVTGVVVAGELTIFDR
jgi:hypothetical protein